MLPIFSAIVLLNLIVAPFIWGVLG